MTTIVTDTITPAAAGAAGRTAARSGHFAWIDVRRLRGALRDAVVQAALQQRIDGIVTDDPGLVAELPPTVRRILTADAPGAADAAAEATAVVDDDHDHAHDSVRADRTGPIGADLVLGPEPASAGVDGETGVHLVVSDAPTLQQACAAVRNVDWTVLTFTDPTKIPLEIVIAAAENSTGRIVTEVADVEDAGIVRTVLEHGSDGLLLAPNGPDDVITLAALLEPGTARITLSELTVTGISHIGMGERACIDTCALLEQDEGCLIGSFATGMFLSCSETHPLPYMPTRPFRWNAGAVHSYVLGPDNRTRYVSELSAGMPITAVRADGTVREVPIGRVKIERRPLISVDARTPDGAVVNLIAQADWHVRLLGPGGSVHNVTELEPGDVLLGYVPTESRHVGLPITEFCEER